jgi:hypothetical protein
LFFFVCRSVGGGDAPRDPETNKPLLNHYVRGGTLDCPGTGTQPYTLAGTEDYPQIGRHDALVEGLDIIGVRVGYRYVGMTPVAFGLTWDLADGATLRMEPKQ